MTIKNNGNVVYDNYPISLKSGESGQIQFTYSLGKTLKNEEFDIEADNGAKAVARELCRQLSVMQVRLQ